MTTQKKQVVVLVAAVLAISVVARTRVGHSQFVTVPDDCGDNLSNAQIAALVTMFASGSVDANSDYIECTEMMTESVLEQFVEDLADLESDPLDTPADINDVHPENLYDPGVGLIDWDPKQLLAMSEYGKKTRGLAIPVRHTGHDWQQHVERGSDGCPGGFDCADVAYCMYNQYTCDEDEDQDLICRFSFDDDVDDPDSARVWAEGSARMNARLRYYQARHGGLNGFGPHSDDRAYVCLGSEDPTRSQNHLHMRHDP